MTKLAQFYEISDVGLKKNCIKHEIPLPQSGYWSKLKFGKKTEIPKLPKINDPEKQIIQISMSELVSTPFFLQC
jgi:hypothetical protein